MEERWHEQLTFDGAVFEGGALLGFGDDERRASEGELASSGAVVAPLTTHGRLRITGADAERFLQAQLTCDVAALGAGAHTLGAYCSRQGRMVASFRLVRLRGEAGADGFVLIAPGDVLEGLEEQLTYFRLRSQVTFTRADEELVHLGVTGSIGDPGTSTDATVLRVGDDPTRHELLVPRERAGETWRRLREAGHEPIGPAAWRLLDVRAGIGWVHEATKEAFLPQMLNLHALGGVSFTKGCFPGQEVVARLRYRGTLKRRAFRLRAATARPPAPGDPVTIVRDGETPDQSGRVVAAAADGPDRVELLAVLPISRVEGADALTLDDGTRLDEAPLPYDVELAFEPEPGP